MPSPNAPKTSEELIREYSQARYLKVNISDHYGRSRGTETAEDNAALAYQARDALARKYGR